MEMGSVFFFLPQDNDYMQNWQYFSDIYFQTAGSRFLDLCIFWKNPPSAITIIKLNSLTQD